MNQNLSISALVRTSLLETILGSARLDKRQAVLTLTSDQPVNTFDSIGQSILRVVRQRYSFR